MKNSLLQRSRDEAKRKEELFNEVACEAHKEYNRLELNFTEETYEFDEALSEHFQRGELCYQYSFEEMLEALLAKAYNTYRMRKSVEGLMLLDHSREDAEDIIKKYDDKKKNEFTSFNRNHPEKIEYWKAKIKYRYANLKQDAEGSKGELDSPKFFSDVVKDSDGYIPFVTTPNFIYTSTFYNYVMGNWDRVSITGGRRSQSVIRQFDRNGRLRVASIIQHFIGKRKACSEMNLSDKVKLKDLSKSKIAEISSNLLIYTKYLGETALKVRFLECDVLAFRTDYKNVIKELEVGTELASKLRKEMKKIIYQQYNYAFRYYYVNDELDEAANVTLLHKYGLFGKKWEIEDAIREEELLIEEEKEVYEYYSI